MEKISKISATVDKILKICYWLFIIASSIVVLAFGIFSITNIPIEGTWTLGLGNVDLELAEHVVENTQIIRVEMISTIIFMIILATFTCYGIKLLRNILAPMIKKQPFVGTVSGNLKKLGWVLISGSIVFGITQCVMTKIIYSVFDITSLFISDNVVDITVNYQIADVKAILTGVLLLLLSHVFCYGEKLQQQDDETL